MQLVILPLYLLCVLSGFLLQVPRRAVLLGGGLRVLADHILVYSFSFVVNLVVPFMFLFVLLFFSLRGVETAFCMAQLGITTGLIKFFLVVICLFTLALLVFSAALVKTTLPFIVEVVVSIIWLFWNFVWVLLVSNLVIFIFFLEILGLLLLIAMLYAFVVASRHVTVVSLNQKLFNTAYATKFFFAQTLLFFLWSSALSMLLLFWSSLFIGIFCCSLDFSLLELCYEFGIFRYLGNSQSGNTASYCVLFLFFFALLLKSAVMPLHVWLVLFYKHMPLLALFLYFIFYYVYFIVVVFNLLFSLLYVFTHVWYCGAIALFGLSSLFMLVNLSEAFTFRQFLAYSSVINVFLLFVFFLVG